MVVWRKRGLKTQILVDFIYDIIQSCISNKSLNLENNKWNKAITFKK